MKLLDCLKENKKVVTIGSICFLSGWLVMGTIDNWLREKFERTPKAEIVTITISPENGRYHAIIKAMLEAYEKQAEKYEKAIYLYQRLTDYLLERSGLKKNLEKVHNDKYGM
jgi:hypothetical protein